MKKFQIKTNNPVKIIGPAAVVGLAGLVAAFLMTPDFLAPKENSASAEELRHVVITDAAPADDTVSEPQTYSEKNSNYSLTVETSAINFNIIPTEAGASQIVSDVVTTTTTAKTGYKLYLSTSAKDSQIRRSEDIISEGQSNWVYPAAGTFDSPAPLEVSSDRPAVWGYAVAGLNKFNNFYSNDNLSSALFAAVPTLGHEQLIRSVDHAVTNDQTTVYYGIKANLGLAGGTYSASINYITLIDLSGLAASVDATDGSDLSTNIPENLTEGYAPEEIEITTPIYTTMSDLGKISVDFSGHACENVYVSSQSPITISCELPKGLSAGAYNLNVSLPKFDKSFTKANALTISPAGYGSAAEPLEPAAEATTSTSTATTHETVIEPTPAESVSAPASSEAEAE